MDRAGRMVGDAALERRSRGYQLVPFSAVEPDNECAIESITNAAIGWEALMSAMGRLPPWQERVESYPYGLRVAGSVRNEL